METCYVSPPFGYATTARCPDCLDPVSGQKLKDITELPDGLAVSTAQDTGDAVAVTYAPDGHQSVFSRAWLAGHALDGDEGQDRDGRTEDDGKELWRPADLARRPEASWPQYLAAPAERARALAAVLRWGFVLLRDVPAEPGLVLDVAASFGFVRETNYGRLFDVRVEPRPGNLAFTSRRILPHTDNPYRDPAPTLQLLHCLRAAGDGGETGLVDGFAAARELRAMDRESFAVLAATPVPFGYRDADTELRASEPLIQLSPRGRVRGIRFNNRSAQPLRRPYAQVTAFYVGLRPLGGAAGPAGAAAEPAARAGRLPDLRQHPDPARQDRVQRDRRPAPAGLLRRPGRAGQHAGRTATRGDAMTAVEAIGELFAGPGARDYLGEPVSIGEHMRQAGALAEAAGAEPALVAAALLHDVGHLRSETEDRHGEAGAGWLSQWFSPAVTEPVRLHVAAKRYLCAADAGYFGLLSAESVRTLSLQGGPMTAAEAAAFGELPHAQDAVAVRRWDDQAKDPEITPPPFAHFAPLLAALARR